MPAPSSPAAIRTSRARSRRSRNGIRTCGSRRRWTRSSKIPPSTSSPARPCRPSVPASRLRQCSMARTSSPTSRSERPWSEIDEVERVQHATKRIWSLYSNEHHDRRCTVRAAELVAEGAIGRVIQTTGIGPHLIRKETRAPVVLRSVAVRAESSGISGRIRSSSFSPSPARPRRRSSSTRQGISPTPTIPNSRTMARWRFAAMAASAGSASTG